MGQTTPPRPGDPRTLGPYRPAGRLGEGGQGVVFAAHAANGGRHAPQRRRNDLSLTVFIDENNDGRSELPDPAEYEFVRRPAQA